MNLQKTAEYFNGDCRTLGTILSYLGHQTLGLLKLDIEGAEYRPMIPIVPAELGEQAGVIGAAARARDLEPGRAGIWTK